jgi:hypothetical protein
MTTRTRYFVIVSLLVLGVGLGTGLVAYYVGVQGMPFARHPGPEELQYLPKDATVVAFANIQEIMQSDLRKKLHQALPGQENGQAELQNLTGINLETDVFRVVACLYADAGSAMKGNGSGMVLARGNFDETKIEGLMRDRGAQVEDYKGKRVVIADVHGDGKGNATPHSFALSFVEPGLAAFGTTDVVRKAIDLHQNGSNTPATIESVTANDELMGLVRSLETGNNAWAVGRFDALTSRANLPANISSQIPAITWFSVGTHVNGGVRGTLRADTRDDEAANNLRDVVRGFLALGKLQSGSRPDIQAMMSSLQLGGQGKTVTLSFDVPAQVFDLIHANLAR